MVWRMHPPEAIYVYILVLGSQNNIIFKVKAQLMDLAKRLLTVAM